MGALQSGRDFLWHGPRTRKGALGVFIFGLSAKILGITQAAKAFPDHFDWQYRVMSSLASQIDNPDGYWKFCMGLAVCFGSFFCLAGYLEDRLETNAHRLAKVSAGLFRLGAFFGFLVGVERGFFHNISSIFYKSHEAIAFAAFFGVFLGVFGFCICWLKGRLKRKKLGWPVIALLLICLPFTGAATSQLLLYVKYRHYGWVSPYWRELGRPVYLSFAFWQWLASFGAFLSMGALCWLSDLDRHQRQRKLYH